jgi:hypothetical protein
MAAWCHEIHTCEMFRMIPFDFPEYKISRLEHWKYVRCAENLLPRGIQKMLCITVPFRIIRPPRDFRKTSEIQINREKIKSGVKKNRL